MMAIKNLHSREKKMRVWTFQPLGTCSKILSGKSYRTDESSIEPTFVKAYNWLSTQMKNKIGNKPEGVTYPVWAWYSYDGVNKKPDRRRRLFTCYKNCELLELEIPESEIVLSDYDSWHYVLNDMWFDNSQNEAEWEELHNLYDSLPLDKQEKYKIASWQKVFDTSIVDTAWMKQGLYVQATFWEIKPEYLISYKTV